jgi:hypothetical protein
MVAANATVPTTRTARLLGFIGAVTMTCNSIGGRDSDLKKRAIRLGAPRNQAPQSRSRCKSSNFIEVVSR